MLTNSERQGSATPARATLDELDPPAWGPPPREATRLIGRVHELRQVPLATLTVEDLRLLVGQRIALHVVVPLSLGILRADPLAEGDLYPGDLLLGVLGLPTDHWRGHPSQAVALREVLTSLDASRPDGPTPGPDELTEAVAAFLAAVDGAAPTATA